jgi:hypothetical protein
MRVLQDMQYAYGGREERNRRMKECRKTTKDRKMKQILGNLYLQTFKKWTITYLAVLLGWNFTKIGSVGLQLLRAEPQSKLADIMKLTDTSI